MDPKKAECIGHYLFGAGYFAQEDNTLGMVTGAGSAQPHFCLTCPKRAECEDAHERRVRRLAPARAEEFDRLMREARRRDMPPTLAAVWIGRQGKDPFMQEAVENFKRGHADRGRERGPLVRND